MGDPATIKVGPVLPYWSMNLSDIGAGKELETADSYYQPARHDKEYRYLLLNGGKGVSDFCILQTDGADARMMYNYVSGDAPKIVPALAQLADLPDVKEGSFEVRYLNIGVIVGSGGG